MAICIGDEILNSDEGGYQDEGLGPNDDDNTGICAEADPCAGVLIEGANNDFSTAYHKRKNLAGDRCLCVCTNPGGVVCEACDGYFQRSSGCGCQYDENQVRSWDIVDGECVEAQGTSGQFCKRGECEDLLEVINNVTCDKMVPGECCSGGDVKTLNSRCITPDGLVGTYVGLNQGDCECVALETGCFPKSNSLCVGANDNRDSCAAIDDCRWRTFNE